MMLEWHVGHFAELSQMILKREKHSAEHATPSAAELATSCAGVCRKICDGSTSVYACASF